MKNNKKFLLALIAAYLIGNSLIAMNEQVEIDDKSRTFSELDSDNTNSSALTKKVKTENSSINNLVLTTRCLVAVLKVSFENQMQEPITGNNALHTLVSIDTTGEALAFIIQNTDYKKCIANCANLTDNQGKTPLVNAILNSHVILVKQLCAITNLRTPLKLDNNATTHLHLAIDQKNEVLFLTIFEALIEQCTSSADKNITSSQIKEALNMKNSLSKNILEHALCKKRYDYFKMILLYKECPVDGILYYAMDQNDLNAFKILLSKEVLAVHPKLAVEKRVKGSWNGYSPLHHAASIAHKVGADYLIVLINLSNDNDINSESRPDTKGKEWNKSMMDLLDTATKTILFNDKGNLKPEFLDKKNESSSNIIIEN